MKKQDRKALVLNRETVRRLANAELTQVAAGAIIGSAPKDGRGLSCVAGVNGGACYVVIMMQPPL